MAGATYHPGDGRLPHEVSEEEPSVSLLRRDGELMSLVLAPDPDVRGGWVATPPEGVAQVMVQRGDQVKALLWPGQSVRLDRVWSAAGDPLVIEREDPQEEPREPSA